MHTDDAFVVIVSEKVFVTIETNDEFVMVGSAAQCSAVQCSAVQAFDPRRRRVSSDQHRRRVHTDGVLIVIHTTAS
jgi:hypothetical protein